MLAIRLEAARQRQKRSEGVQTSGAIAGMFTALVTTPPVRAATTCSAAW